MADNDQFIPERTGRIGIGTPAAYLDALREGAGIPPPPPDPPRGSLTEGRDIAPAFTELIREGKACAYRLMGITAYTMTGGKINAGEHLFLERDGLLNGYRRDGGADHYSGTMDRALRTYTALVPRLLTDEEAKAYEERDKEWGKVAEKSTDFLLKYTSDMYVRHCEEHGVVDPKKAGLRRFRVGHYALPDMTDIQLRKYYAAHPWPAWYRNGTIHEEQPANDRNAEGFPAGTKIIATSAQVFAEERIGRWAIEFAAEVEVCVERFADCDELPKELNRLIETLRSFEVGAGEAKAYVENLRSTGIGQEVIAMMQHGKNRLLQRLEEIAKEHATETINPLGQGQRLKWQGNTSELCELIHLLAENGWIEVPKSRSKLADRVHAVFQGIDGEPLDLASLKQYLKGSAHRPLRAGVSFEVSIAPVVN
jgi:hypothetical protein